MSQPHPNTLTPVIWMSDYDAHIGSQHDRIYDTAGLEDSRHRLDAIEKAYRLVTSVSVVGGIHLLVLCFGAGGPADAAWQTCCFATSSPVFPNITIFREREPSINQVVGQTWTEWLQGIDSPRSGDTSKAICKSSFRLWRGVLGVRIIAFKNRYC
ncbi:hypothetical protein BV22DRAFT_436882 [Leucogyrophana mollusca]|uniref:Uncharacterized protein n=1 Tax=Leucogyrophana mollusca TaxID=85980 RepID=A0ACB8BIP3_9AGAM|nr:hypothetical protein BV22DRAFT_436882 [Leucogyrophana mollusca]